MIASGYGSLAHDPLFFSSLFGLVAVGLAWHIYLLTACGHRGTFTWLGLLMFIALLVMIVIATLQRVPTSQSRQRSPALTSPMITESLSTHRGLEPVVGLRASLRVGEQSNEHRRAHSQRIAEDFGVG
jgi:hypothetical protein